MKLFDEGALFYKGNTHMHTTLSDGRLSPQEAALLYRQSGYHFVFLTDHRMASLPSECEGMLVLSGTELDVTLPDQCVHIVGLGVDAEQINAMQLKGRNDLCAQQLIDVIRDAGGRAILAHPAWSLNTVELMQSLQGLTAAEVYNTFSGEPWNAERADSSHILDVLSAQGTSLNLVASDDSHRYNGEACRSYIMVQARTLSQEDILEALDRGAFYASQGPSFEQIERIGDTIRVRCSPVERITFCSAQPWSSGRCHSGHGMMQAEHKLHPAGEPYVRVVLTDMYGRRAWSNPIRTN
ncbi:hypothetical protein LJC33_03855 [Eubacteriales bacterium OttesenSCG-928-N13]|nr:hypothetical protein [Eubacteriales bacterium OttesenSCG-928-N13]